jgi:hypothetical protein
MLFPGMFFPVLCMYIIHTTLVDSKASGEESKVPLRSDECRPTGNTAAQTKEEGWQDGLRLHLPGGSGGARSPWHWGYPLHLFLASIVPPLSPFPSIPSLQVLLFDVAIRR